MSIRNIDTQRKRLALDALDIKAIVTRKRVQGQGVIQIDSVTRTTSECLPFHAYTLNVASSI